MNTFKLSILAIAALFLLGSCGDDDDNDSNSVDAALIVGTWNLVGGEIEIDMLGGAVL